MKIKAIKEQYVGKRFNEDDSLSVIRCVVSIRQSDGRDTVALLSKSNGYYDVEALIDRDSGENLIPDRTRPADSIADSKYVAMEMYEDMIKNGVTE